MNILLVSDEFPPVGNKRSYLVYDLVKYFSGKKNIEIHLLTTSKYSEKKELFADNVFITYIDIGRADNRKKLSIFEKIKFSFKVIYYINTVLKKKKNFDVIHIFSLFSAFIILNFIKIKDKKIFLNIFKDDIYGFFSFFKSIFVNSVIKKSTKCFVNSQRDLNFFSKSKYKDKIQLIYSGVEIKKSFFDINFFFTKNKKLTILFVDHLDEKKGYEYILNGLKGINDYRIIVIGEGKYKKYFEKLSIKLGIDAEFKGNVEPDDMKKIMKHSDIFFNLSYDNGISYRMLQAMSYGLPIIAFDFDENREVISDNGFLIKKFDYNDFKKVLDIYRNNTSLLKKHSSNSKKLINNFSLKNMCEKYFEFYV